MSKNEKEITEPDLSVDLGYSTDDYLVALRVQAARIATHSSERKDEILLNVAKSLDQRIPVEITDEMKELGLEMQIRQMLIAAEVSARFERLFSDDEPEDDGYPPGFR